MPRSEQGFTLVETLFALSILAVMLLLVPKLQMEKTDQLELEHFLDTLEMDVLYLQNTTSTQEISMPYVLRFHPDHYSIVHNRSTKIVRDYPSQFVLETSYPNDVEFYVSGVIRNPQTIWVRLAGKPYRIVFPLGKGRYYVEKR